MCTRHLETLNLCVHLSSHIVALSQPGTGKERHKTRVFYPGCLSMEACCLTPLIFLPLLSFRAALLPTPLFSLSGTSEGPAPPLPRGGWTADLTEVAETASYIELILQLCGFSSPTFYPCGRIEQLVFSSQEPNVFFPPSSTGRL